MKILSDITRRSRVVHVSVLYAVHAHNQTANTVTHSHRQWLVAAEGVGQLHGALYWGKVSGSKVQQVFG